MKEKKDIKDIRREYDYTELSEKSVPEDPIVLFEKWISEAIEQVKDPTAMILSTVAEDNKPSSRIVLLKEYSSNGFTFFTNYMSRKGKELVSNKYASLLFYWQEFDRQIRIEGEVSKCTEEVSNQYFDSRPKESRLAAIISNQSERLESREQLDDQFMKLTALSDNEMIRPEFWGGYLLKANKIEFWQGRENRLHDRIVYEMKDGEWKIYRLAP